MPANQPVLALLDAYLEALWGGEEIPLPKDLVGHAPHGEEELVGWALDRLYRIPREPKDVFVSQAGDLLMRFRGRRCPWNAAALRLLADAYVFAATGPRQHEDWAHDVRAVLHRSVPDPRGWIRLDWDRANAARDAVPAYPFDPPAAAQFPDRLYPLEAGAAVGALAIMTEEWWGEPVPVRSRPDREALLTDARHLLTRYGPTARYWTNAKAAAAGPAPNFVAAGLQGTRSHSFLTSAYVNGLDLHADLGLIAVSDDEVGVFWSIDAS